MPVRSEGSKWPGLHSVANGIQQRWDALVTSFRPLVIAGAIGVVLAAAGAVYLAQVQYKAWAARPMLAAAVREEEGLAAKGYLVHRIFTYDVTSPGQSQPIESGTVDLEKYQPHGLASRY